MSTPNHPFNLTYLINTLTIQLVSQPGHNKPRPLWDEEERADGRPRTDTIQILLVRPGECPELVTIGNDLETMRAVIGGPITTFETGVEGTIGVSHDEAILLQMPPNRYIPATSALIFGPLFIAGNGTNLHSLSEQELTDALRAFVPPLTLEQVYTALCASDESLEGIEREMNDALDE